MNEVVCWCVAIVIASVVIVDVAAPCVVVVAVLGDIVAAIIRFAFVLAKSVVFNILAAALQYLS